MIEDNRIDHWLSVGGCDWCATRRNTVTCKECSGFIGMEAIGSYLIFTALEWQACAVEGNGSNDLPPSQPFSSPAPTASFTVPTEVKIGEKAEFLSTARAAAGQEVQCVLWDLGDGPPLAGPQTRHVYDRAGQYLVTQIVWDRAGRAARSAARIAVKQ